MTIKELIDRIEALVCGGTSKDDLNKGYQILHPEVYCC